MWDHRSWDHLCGGVPLVAPDDHLGRKHAHVNIMLSIFNSAVFT